MKMKQMLGTMVVVVLYVVIGAAVSFAAPTNVAQGKPVTLNGASFFTGGWGSGLVVGADTIVDGSFFARHHQWDQGPVWWDSNDDEDRWIEIDLEGTFVIESLIVQADDNDAYKLYYWDISSSSWQLLWDVPNYDVVPDPANWGMQTRPNPDDDTERYMLASPIVTNALKFEGNMADTGDKLFSVSEIQAYGSPVLEVTKELTEISDFIDEDEDGEPDLDIDGYPMVPMHTEITFTMVITVTNNDPAATIEDVVVKDRLGGDLKFISSDPAPTSYVTKGNSDKVFLSWELGDLGSDSKEIILTVATDVNPGQGKKAEPKNEYTSPGIHDLNSGANAKGMLGDLQVSDSSDSITVNAVEPIDD